MKYMIYFEWEEEMKWVQATFGFLCFFDERKLKSHWTRCNRSRLMLNRHRLIQLHYLQRNQAFIETDVSQHNLPCLIIGKPHEGYTRHITAGGVRTLLSTSCTVLAGQATTSHCIVDQYLQRLDFSQNSQCNLLLLARHNNFTGKAFDSRCSVTRISSDATHPPTHILNIPSSSETPPGS